MNEKHSDQHTRLLQVPFKENPNVSVKGWLLSLYNVTGLTNVPKWKNRINIFGAATWGHNSPPGGLAHATACLGYRGSWWQSSYGHEDPSGFHQGCQRRWGTFAWPHRSGPGSSEWYPCSSRQLRRKASERRERDRRGRESEVWKSITMQVFFGG